MATINDTARRSGWKIRHALHGMPMSALVTQSVSKSGCDVWMLAPVGQKS